jgi:hypothetical protein
VIDPSEIELQLTQVADALAELYDLLERYASPWYTQEHHARIESILRGLKSYNEKVDFLSSRTPMKLYDSGGL